jgi:hypothetical protein
MEYPHYRISKTVRKYSSTPVVRVTLDEKGKEQEEIVCLCTETKKKGDLLAPIIVHALNKFIDLT